MDSINFHRKIEIRLIIKIFSMFSQGLWTEDRVKVTMVHRLNALLFC